MDSVWSGVIQFRPSGVRVKKPDYLPALVAMNQTSIIGSRRRTITVREAARLQAFPESFSFGDQNPAQSFKQLGNAVSVGTVKFVLTSILDELNVEL
jgi:DNA (cytosine-5)-methyltransferase 1